jgi:hypothetical protein
MPTESRSSISSPPRRRARRCDGSNLQTRPLDLPADWLGHENISEVLNFSRRT